MKKLLLFSVLIIFCNSYSQDIHSFDEILSTMMNSSVKYNMTTLDKLIPAVDNSENINTNYYYRVEKNKEIKLYENDIKGKAKDNLQYAEYYFSKYNFDDAIEYYKKAYDEDTTAYFILTYIGQCYLALDELDDAAKYFKLVIKKNYIDYMAHWFLADLYGKKGNWNEAVKEITIANVLNRNNPRLMTALKSIYKYAKIGWKDFQFNPQIKLERIKNDSVLVAFDKTWMTYAMVKSVWAFEKGYKESMGVKDNIYSITEEIEALGNLYLSLKKTETDYSNYPELVVMVKSTEEKMIYPYVMYEIMLVKYPLTVYTLPRGQIDKLVEYVLKYRTIK
jgi:tetratricopeptide (TPR) repeat protein